MHELSDPVVTLRNVSKWYGQNHVLKNANLDIREGEVVTLLGPSGSGKTTLLRLVAGFIPTTTGTILLRGRDVTYTPPQKRNTAMVFQSYALFPHKTVAENLAFGLRMRKLPRQIVTEKVKHALQLIHLDEYGERMPKHLSGGEQQRVALMRALITEPDVLLMDEPLGALDRKLREQMQLEIKSFLTRMRITALYVTHDQEEALVLSDRIAVMSKGIIEQVDPPIRIYNEPHTPFVADFVGVSNLLEGRISSSNGEHCEIATDRGLTIKGLSSAAPGEAVHVVLRPEKLSIRLDGEPGAAANDVAGRVGDVRYLGLSVQYVVETNDGHSLIVTQLSMDQPEQLLEPGTTVRLAFGVEVPRILREGHSAVQEVERLTTASGVVADPR